ncbi:tetratricopeptide repeat protein [Priestia koreensis]|uniref:tetratricopeptide repeat protein n=1 Tax=Priestia koreensis TaxID=284581 RepID=UPI00345AC678
MKEYDKALTDYNKAIELAPNEDHYYYLRGNLYKETEDYEKTLADCNKAIELAPDEKPYYIRDNLYKKITSMV